VEQVFYRPDALLVTRVKYDQILICLCGYNGGGLLDSPKVQWLGLGLGLLHLLTIEPSDYQYTVVIMYIDIYGKQN